MTDAFRVAIDAPDDKAPVHGWRGPFDRDGGHSPRRLGINTEL